MTVMQLGHSAHQATSKKFQVCFLANDIDIAVNVGSFFRIADALGVEKIYLTGRSVIPPHPRIKKASRATERFVPYSYTEDPLTVVRLLKTSGYKMVSLEITSNSIDIEKFDINAGEKICLILGSEDDGICQELLEISDATIHIPMMGHNSSMNVASACSIATYEITRKLKNGA